MATMEYECRDCGYVEFSNRHLTWCPKCGSVHLLAAWDEENDDHGEFYGVESEARDG